MPDHRTHRSVAERLDIEFQRTPDRTRRRRRIAMALCGMLPLAVIGAFAAIGKQDIYWAGPVTAPHRFIANDCGQCHTEHWQPMVRLVSGDASARSVDDSACRHCHGERSTDHSPIMTNAQDLSCVLCHQEHRGGQRLNWVADAICANCHGGDLKTTKGSSDRFASNIDTFARHPEFALHRDAAEDTAKIRFNHALHLDPQGVLLPHDHSQNSDGKQRKVLACSDCHQPTDDGRLIRPIVYEQHCGECHPLAFDTKTAGETSLPHEELALVKGLIRDRLMAYAERHPAEVGDEIDATPLPRSPRKRGQPATLAKDRWEWVEGQMSVADENLLRHTKNGCALCHEFTVNSDGGIGAISPTEIPRRWLPHSRFNHGSHEMLKCSECHAASQSKLTADILMPRIENCRQCHGPTARTVGDVPARSDCVECHGYHNHSEASEGRPIGDFLGGP